jgi:hypothetical protein
MGMVTLRRYTNLVAAIQLLRLRSITLLDPQLWDDKNDSYAIRQYGQAKSARSVLALCFAEQHETYHHWSVFAPGPHGICFEFHKEALLSAFVADARVKCGNMAYRELRQLRETPPSVDELPFVKRFPYKDEMEFRVVYTNLDEVVGFKDYPIDLGAIKAVNLSPWMPKVLSDSIKETIRAIDGCSKIKINRSTLVENSSWKSYVDRALVAR